MVYSRRSSLLDPRQKWLTINSRKMAICVLSLLLWTEKSWVNRSNLTSQGFLKVLTGCMRPGDLRRWAHTHQLKLIRKTSMTVVFEKTRQRKKSCRNGRALQMWGLVLWAMKLELKNLTKLTRHQSIQEVGDNQLLTLRYLEKAISLLKTR